MGREYRYKLYRTTTLLMGRVQLYCSSSLLPLTLSASADALSRLSLAPMRREVETLPRVVFSEPIRAPSDSKSPASTCTHSSHSAFTFLRVVFE